MDLWLRTTNKNISKTKKALTSLGYDVDNIEQIFQDRPIDHVNHFIEIKGNIKRIGYNDMKDLIDADKLKSIHQKKPKRKDRTKNKRKGGGI